MARPDGCKLYAALSIADLRRHPVWRMLLTRDSDDELHVRPLMRLPASNLEAKLVGTEVRLANGTSCWAMLSHIDAQNPRLTRHFLSAAFHKDGKWFLLSRYHDIDYEQRGPAALAEFLNLPVDAIFPITYDIRSVATGDPAALAGAITLEPEEKLTRDQIIALAVPRREDWGE